MRINKSKNIEKTKTSAETRRDGFLGRAKVARELADLAIAQIDEVINDNMRIVANQHSDTLDMAAPDLSPSLVSIWEDSAS